MTDLEGGGTAQVPRPGQRVGRYRLVERLGEGGMGSVYLADDPELDRKVALKLLGSADADEASRRRTLREAKAMAMLQHPNVATVFDVGTHGGFVFITMEYVDGWTAHDWVRRQRPSWQAIVDVFAQAGRGLLAAHEAGLIHRDIKPSNVLVGRDGRTRVGDFGLARRDRRSAPATAPPPMDEATPTFDSAVVGTPAYMAPEQHLGQPVDARSDQFSLCVSLWEALYRQPPFDAATPFAVLTQIVEGKLRPPPAGTSVPARLQQALERGLSADPDKRFATLASLLEVLDDCAHEGELQPPPSSVASPPSAAQFPTRYRVEGLLADGATEGLYRVVDGVTGHVLAARRPDVAASASTSGRQPASLPGLEVAFRALLSLRHPHIVPVVDVGLDTRREPYVVLALGDDARPVLDAAGGMRLGRQVELLGELLLALDALHRRGVVHDDVHPQSVVVTKRGLQLLWCDSALDGWQRRDASWGYVAPEVLMGKPPSPVSDLYAVGALAFHLWAGRALSSAASWEEATDAALAASPALDELSVSDELRQWMAGMLHKRPEGRLVSAIDAIALLREASGCALDERTAVTIDCGLRSAPLWGRGDALRQLRRELDRSLERGQPRRVWLVGPSGAGKSRLLSELGAIARARGADVVGSPSLDEPSPPYQVWGEALRTLGVEPPEHEGAPAAQQRRLADALVRASAASPQATVVLLDDVERAGEESKSVLAELARADQPSLLVVASERTDGGIDLDPHALIHLQPLDRAAVSKLASAALGDGAVSNDVADRIVGAGDAWPLTVIERLRALAEKGANSEIATALTLDEALSRRLAALPAEQAALTATAAAAGQVIGLGVMLRAHPGADLDAWLSTLRRAAIIEPHAGSHRFTHAALRDAVLAQAGDDETASAHGRVVAGLKESDDVEPERIAHHAHLAGLADVELEYLALATERALTVDDSRAERLCRRALALADGAARLTKARLWRWLSLALAGQQRVSDALVAVRKALSYVGRTLPSSKLGQWWSILTGMVRLALRPPPSTVTPVDGRSVRAELAATLDLACRCLASAGHTRELLATCTSALEADLRAGRSGALPLALLAYAVGRRAPRLATRTLAVARARARAVEPDIEATVFIVDACYLATRGEIDRSAARARDAVAHADAQLDAARARCIQAQLLRCRGQLDELVRESEQLYEGTRVGDVDRATAIACLAAALHACGRDAEAQARLAESAGCQALELDAAALHAEHAVAASRAGQWEAALDHAQQAEAAMNALSITLWLGQPLLGVSEALLETWRQADRDDARDRCITLAARWRSLVRHQPLLRAPWRLFVGRMAQADGRSSVACRHFEMALQEAQTLSLPLWEGEAHAALAGAIDEPRRADEHRELARGLLGRCGARHALSLLESADR